MDLKGVRDAGMAQGKETLQLLPLLYQAGRRDEELQWLG